MSKPYGDGFRYNIGDLVKFKVARHTEDYHSYVEKVGIVVEQSLNYTKDILYKINVKGKDYWIRSSHITLLSKAPKRVSK